MGDWLVAGFGFVLPQVAFGKARKPMAYFRIYCPTRLTRRTRPTFLLITSAKLFFAFRLLLGGEGAIIWLVSRKAILETLIFEIPAAVTGAAGWLTRIG